MSRLTSFLVFTALMSGVAVAGNGGANWHSLQGQYMLSKQRYEACRASEPGAVVGVIRCMAER